ncbi:ATP-binding protein [Corallococcus macrosporus]|uniref:Kinase n=1 Tax=Corallococcus macrosporus DSM 14697 TaxID=1189310 RepID=A0A250K2I4_9BACT|nr:ATP-binding protein [Corallococcus macrosporus]ATB50100.1 kinase [Corallococcus macrosporus DSM 14697]
MDLVLFVGLQGSGKSSLYRQRFEATHVHVSKDLWPHAVRKEARQRRYVAEALAAGRSVVVDNTNPSQEVRAPLIALGREYQARILGYYFASNLEDCLARNALRQGRARVPEVALRATVKQLQRPRLEEGFDSLYYVTIDAEGGLRVEPWKEEPDGPA